MTKSLLVDRVCTRHKDLDRQIVEGAVNLFFKMISDVLLENGRAEIRGFGVFCTRERRQRTGRNPRTGESVEVSKKAMPFFKAGRLFFSSLNVDTHTPTST